MGPGPTEVSRTAATSGEHAGRARRVPVEHRWLGLDRRTLPPALVVLGLSLALIFGWRGLDAAIGWDDQIRPGDVIDLGDGASVQPPVGWQLESGVRVGDGEVSPRTVNVTLADGGAVIDMRGAAFQGSAAEFLDQVEESEGDVVGLDGPRGSLRTEDGLVGVTRVRSTQGGDRFDVAFKMATGPAANSAPALFVRVGTAPGQFAQRRAELEATLRSIAVGSTS